MLLISALPGGAVSGSSSPVIPDVLNRGSRGFASVFLLRSYNQRPWILAFARMTTEGVKSERTPAAHIGSIMALLATFHEAGALPPESSREADRLIHGLIQSQSLFLNNRDPVVRDVFISALSDKFGAKKAASLSQAFASQGWTSETLEALVDYSASWSPADTSRLAEAFRGYNLSIIDWTFVRQVFAEARDKLRKQGKQVHAVFASQRASMPGAR